MDGAPGFYGKLPSHGDFVGRRLPPDVRDCFDRWLQGALVHSKADLGDAWLPTWLSSPLWRFVVGPGVCGEQAWAGVMMPSHDRVGRCFPLLLAAPIDGMPLLRDCLSLHGGWLEQLEELALAALGDCFTLETLDMALIALDGPLQHGSTARFPYNPVTPPARIQLITSWTALDAPGLPSLAEQSLNEQSAWWSEGSLRVAPCLAVCAGLPPSAGFAALLDGRWMQRGWEMA